MRRRTRQLTRLLWYLDRELFQNLDVANVVDDRPQKVEARLKDLVKFAHSFDDPCFLCEEETVHLLICE